MKTRFGRTNSKYHDSGTVVEQAFTDNLGFQRLGYTDFAQDAQHGNRIVRRNQRPEQQAIY